MKQAAVQVSRFEDWGSQAIKKNGTTAHYKTASRLTNRNEINYRQRRKIYNLYNNVTVWSPFCYNSDSWGDISNPVKCNRVLNCFVFAAWLGVRLSDELPLPLHVVQQKLFVRNAAVLNVCQFRVLYGRHLNYLLTTKKHQWPTNWTAVTFSKQRS